MKGLKVEGERRRRKKEGFKHKGFFGLRLRFLYEVENASFSHVSIVGRVARKFHSIHYDLYVTLKLIVIYFILIFQLTSYFYAVWGTEIVHPLLL
jgi:hypothetical protein